MITLPSLPYAHAALEPTMSEETLRFHYGRHHAAYIDKTNALAADAGLSGRSLPDIIMAAKERGLSSLFNNAAQAWNHKFFWSSMTPAYAAPTGELASAIVDAFGSLAELRTKFVETGLGHFGSGWIWLASTAGGKLALHETHDGDTLVTHSSLTPLLVCDVWEHAYYLDKQNDRKAYLEQWFDKLANWNFAAENFAAINATAEPA